MKMKKTDIGVVFVMYAISAFFYAQATQLNAESRTYPMFTIILLFALTTLYLIQMIVAAKKFGVESGKDEVFEGFKPLQFFICLALVVLYLVMIYIFGFYISTIVFMLAALLYLRVPIIPTVVTVAVINLLIYFAFSKFLGVKLPAGLLF